MTSTLATKMGFLLILVVVLAAILADQALKGKADSPDENKGEKHGSASIEIQATEPEEMQDQVRVDWKKRSGRYAYEENEEEEKAPEWKWWGEENRPHQSDSGE